MVLLAGCFTKPPAPADSTCAFTNWSTPPRLLSLNDKGGYASTPALAPDGHTLVYAQSSDGMQWDLYETPPPDFKIGQPIPSLATAASETSPAWSFDGTQLYVTIDAGNQPEVSSFDGTTFSAPMPANELAAAGFVRRPRFTADGLDMVLSVGFPDVDLFEATRAGTGDPWPSPTMIAGLSTVGANEYSPVLSADGLAILYTSDASGSSHVMVATRPRRTASFGSPTDLGDLGVAGALGPDLSADGNTLFLVGFPGAASVIYELTRTCH